MADETTTEQVAEEPEAAIPTESEAKTEPVWATPDSLPTQLWKDTVLPELGQWVRVRFMSDMEAAHLAFVPDLAEFTEMIAKRITTRDAQELEPDYIAKFQAEQTRYLTWVAHLSVMDTNAAPAPVDCACGMKHPPSLWSREQTQFLGGMDLQVIASVAERRNELLAMLPFSEAKQESESPEPVSIGEST